MQSVPESLVSNIDTYAVILFRQLINSLSYHILKGSKLVLFLLLVVHFLPLTPQIIRSSRTYKTIIVR